MVKIQTNILLFMSRSRCRDSHSLAAQRGAGQQIKLTSDTTCSKMTWFAILQVWYRAQLGGRFGYFLFFLLRGRKGGVRGPGTGGEGSVFIEKSQEGGESQRGRMGVRGAGRVWEFSGGGGLNIFFFGPKCPPRQKLLNPGNVKSYFWKKSPTQGRAPKIRRKQLKNTKIVTIFEPCSYFLYFLSFGAQTAVGDLVFRFF